MDTDEIVQKMVLESSIDMENVGKLYPILKSYDRSFKAAKIAHIAGNVILSTLSLGLLGGGIAMFVKGLKDNNLVPSQMLILSSAAVSLPGMLANRLHNAYNKNTFKRGYKKYKHMAEELGQELISEQGYEEAVNDYKNLTFSEILTQGDSFKIGEVGNFSQLELMLMHGQFGFANEIGDMDRILTKIEGIAHDQEIYDVFGEEFLNQNKQELDPQDSELNL